MANRFHDRMKASPDAMAHMRTPASYDLVQQHLPLLQLELQGRNTRSGILDCLSSSAPLQVVAPQAACACLLTHMHSSLLLIPRLAQVFKLSEKVSCPAVLSHY